MTENSDTYLKGLRARKVATREEAATALGQLRVDSTVPALARALSDRRSNVALAAAAALANMGDAGVSALLAATGSQRHSTQLAAARGLSALGDVRALPIFVAAIESGDLDSYADAIGGLAELDEVDAVIAALIDPASPRHLQELAADALGQIESEVAREALEKAAAESSDEYVRRAARDALGPPT